MAEQLKNATAAPDTTTTEAVTAGTTTDFDVTDGSVFSASGTFRIVLRGTADDGSDDALGTVGSRTGNNLAGITWIDNGQTTFASGVGVDVVLSAEGLDAAIDDRVADHAALTTAHAAATNLVHTTGNETVAGDKIWSGQQDYNGTQYFNAGIFSQGIDQFADITAFKLRTTPNTVGPDWINTILGIPNTFTTNARTSGNTNFTTDTALTGLTPSATTYAVNTTTGEVVAMTAHLGGDVTFTIARGQLTGIGGAAAAAISATDVWYILPYGQYALDMAALIDNAADYDTTLLQGVGVWMPLQVKLADIATYNTAGRNFNFLINPDEWGLAPMNVSYAGGAFTEDFTATSGYKSMYLTAAPGGADYIIIGAY